MSQKNEFKVSIMRNFGTEQVSCTGTIYSSETNPEKACKEVLKGFHAVIDEAFVNTVKRHDEENKYIAEQTKTKEAVKAAQKEINKK